jgi:periplasmic protein TonB
MPRALFDQTLPVRTHNARPVGTISLSVLLHAVALAAVIVFHVTASSAPLPEAPSVPGVFVPPPRAATPPAPRVRTATPTKPVASIVPTVAPTTITKESETPPVAGPPSTSINVAQGPSGLPDLGPASNVRLSAPPQQAPKPTFVRVGGEIKTPTRLVYVPPSYPSIAQTARVEGEVVLEATIDETGAVKNVVVRQSIPLLDRAAIEAVSKWRYSPTLLNGEPVAVIMTVGVRFSLR